MTSSASRQTAEQGIARLLAGRHHDPFEILGCHRQGAQWQIRALLPDTVAAEVVIDGHADAMERRPGTDFFHYRAAQGDAPAYRIRRCTADGEWRESEDPYRFRPVIGDLDLHLFAEGHHQHLYRVLGAHCCQHQGVAGVRFATWAPNAQRVSVVGDFNRWHGLAHTMRSRGPSGVWELFIPGLGPGEKYKFELFGAGDRLLTKTDPYGNRFELRPATAAEVCAPTEFNWTDAAWLAQRAAWDWQRSPISIYELHPGS